MVLLGSVIAGVGTSPALGAGNVFLSALYTGTPPSGGPFTYDFTGTWGGASPLQYMAFLPVSGLTVTGGGFASGPTGMTIYNGDGPGSFEFGFNPPYVAPGSTFSVSITFSGLLVCGTPLNTAVNSANDPPNKYTNISIPFGSTCPSSATWPNVRSVADAAAVLSALVGVDPRDPSTVHQQLKVDFTATFFNPAATPTTPFTLILGPGSTPGITFTSLTCPVCTPGSAPNTFNIGVIQPQQSVAMTGTLALLKQLHPDWSVEELKALLVNSTTGQPLGPPIDTSFGDTRTDILGEGVTPPLWLDPVVTFPHSADPFATVAAGGRRVAGLWGTFHSKLPAGTPANVLAPGVADPNQITKAQVALVLVKGGQPSSFLESSKARTSRAPSCFDVKLHGKLKRLPFSHGTCQGLTWQDAKIVPGTDRFYFPFDSAHRPPAGRIYAFSRALTRAGAGDPGFSGKPPRRKSGASAVTFCYQTVSC
jgi:hypothetical protein